MKIAILGYGSIAGEHARAIQTLQHTPEGRDLELYAVMGRREEPAREFARQFGLKIATTDLAVVLDDPAVDVVLVTSPTDLHAEQTTQALEAGKQVLCEIPLATSLDDTDRLIALAEAKDARLMVCHTQRYFPALRAARRMIVDGELHPHAVVSRYMFQRRDTINWLGHRRSWIDNLIWHHGCHAVDAALWLLGAEAVDIAAQVALPGPDLGIPMDLGIVMRTPRDQVITVAMSYNTHIPLHDYLVIGEETTVLFEIPTSSGSSGEGQLRTNDRVLVEAKQNEGLEHPIARQDADFFAAVREHREPPVSARSVRPAMAALQQVQDIFEARLREAGAEAKHPRYP